MSPAKAERVMALAERLAEAAAAHDTSEARVPALRGPVNLALWQDYLVARDARANARDALIRECEEPDTEDA